MNKTMICSIPISLKSVTVRSLHSHTSDGSTAVTGNNIEVGD